MESFTVVIRGESAVASSSGNTTVLRCRLAKSYILEGTYMVRLQAVHGTKKPLAICAPFVKPQDFDGSLRPILGTTIDGGNSFVPLSANYIPSTTWLSVETMDNTTFNNTAKLVFFIRFAPVEAVREF